MGVKNSTSDLLIANCDEFIFYDDLVRASKPARRKKKTDKTAKKTKAVKKTTPEDERKQIAFDLVVETAEALFNERGDQEKTWGSMVKQALKRRNPGFSESYYGFRSFGQLLEEAQTQNLMTLELDEKSGGYIIRRLLPED